MPTLIELMARATGTDLASWTQPAAPIAAAPAPAIEEPRRVVPAYLSGRCSNGYAHDRGRVVHALEVSAREARYGIGAYARSLCGVTHGARSAGWTHGDAADAVTCPRCARLAAGR